MITYPLDVDGAADPRGGAKVGLLLVVRTEVVTTTVGLKGVLGPVVVGIKGGGRGVEVVEVVVGVDGEPMVVVIDVVSTTGVVPVDSVAVAGVVVGTNVAELVVDGNDGTELVEIVVEADVVVESVGKVESELEEEVELENGQD